MSNQPINERTRIPDLKDPILLTAFSSQSQGGATAASTLTYAVEHWHAELVADFEAEAYYNYARVRPWVRVEGNETVVDWPQNVVYRVDGPDHSYLVLVGVEPSLNWQGFIASIGDFATRMGVRTAINLKSVPAMVPHTIDAPVRAIYSTPQLIEDYGFQELEDKDGPGDIGRILNLHLAANCCSTIDLYASEPFYAAATPNASASMSLLRALKEGFDLAVDLERLREVAEIQRKAIDATVASSDQLRETVLALEQRASLTGESGQGGLPSPIATEATESELEASDVLLEVEEILRGSRQ